VISEFVEQVNQKLVERCNAAENSIIKPHSFIEQVLIPRMFRYIETSSDASEKYRMITKYKEAMESEKQAATLKTEKSEIEYCEKYSQVYEQFMKDARSYGEIIVSEFKLPHYHKTIESVMIGGVAGGEKFINR
jgi:hypothetical protein